MSFVAVSDLTTSFSPKLRCEFLSGVFHCFVVFFARVDDCVFAINDLAIALFPDMLSPFFVRSAARFVRRFAVLLPNLAE